MTDRAALPLQSILDCVGWADAPLDLLRIDDGPDLLPTRYPLADIATGTLAAVGLAASELGRLGTGRAQTVTVDRAAAGIGMSRAEYLRVDGEIRDRWDPVTGFYPARDGRWVYLHGNFPHLRDGLLALLGAENSKESVAQAVAGWDADALEDAGTEAGLCTAAVRTREQWQAHPHRRAVAALPLVEITRVGDAPPRPLPDAERPLGGVRVLDCTRVIAGPMAGRTFAEHGADVLRINGPHLPFIEALVINTGIGKRSCFVDLRDADGVATLEKLTTDADVFFNSYRPGALVARGFGPERLAEMRPGIVSVSLDAWSRAGPFAPRRGYDSLVQATYGLSVVGEDGRPKRLPCQPLDYLTGYLAAFGAMEALRRRVTEGGSWQVSLSLARIAEWIFEMTDELGFIADVPDRAPTPDELGAWMQEMESDFGRLRFLRPAVSMSETPPSWDHPPVPLGTDPAVWI
ncbi:MAG: CoA transferase [Alphaproteobacteria bacterium]